MVLLVRKSEFVACKQRADQLAHQCSLISTFFIYCLVNKMAIHEILNSFKIFFFFNIKKVTKIEPSSMILVLIPSLHSENRDIDEVRYLALLDSCACFTLLGPMELSIMLDIVKSDWSIVN